MRLEAFSVNLLVVGLLMSLPAAAQRVEEPTATFPEPFSQVVGIRQLSDGRLILADRLEQHVSYIDFATGSVRQISREGQGPGEYQQPMGLTPYPDDGTLLTDFGNMRISLIEKNGRITDTWPMMAQGEGGGMQFIRPAASDGDGHIYFSTFGVFMRGPGGGAQAPSDSAYLIRYDLDDETSDTLASLFMEPISQDGEQAVRINGGAARVTGLAMRPYRAQDGWSVTRDGRVVIVRATDYRIDRVDTAGNLTRGRPNTYDRVRVGRAEKEAWASSSSGGSMNMVVASGSGSRTSNSFSIPTPDIDEIEFPEFMPPFGTNAVSLSPTGDVWVELNTGAGDDGPVFDVFSPTGQKLRQVRLQSGRRLVGFGDGTYYAVAVDEDDLQWLEQYRYPNGT